MKNNGTNKLRVALGAALAVGLATAASGAFAASGAAPGGAAVASAPARGGHVGAGRVANHGVARARGSRNAGWGLWGNTGGFVYGAPQSPGVEGGPPGVASLSEHLTITYDVPWDSVHRYYPGISEAPQGCRTQHQTVPRVGGGEQTVNIISCY